MGGVLLNSFEFNGDDRDDVLRFWKAENEGGFLGSWKIF
jgi:hypothetical protein